MPRILPLRPSRRRALASLGAGAAALALPRGTGVAAAADDVCANGTTFDRPLALPGRDGWLGWLDARAPLTLRAAAGAGAPTPLAYVAASSGRTWRNPSLLTGAGARFRLTFANALDAPTIVHWHGLVVDTRNDGNGATLAAPGARFEYDFPVANRAGLYWYHPHPHGATAEQVQRGLFGMLFVEDDEEGALRRALAVERGAGELALVLHDTKSASPFGYAPTADDRLLGQFGDELLVNGTARPYCDVAARGYRLRVVNAANARNFRLGFRRPDGALLDFALLGVDGGLLERPLAVRELFVSPSERVDLWIDFGALAVGDFVVAESLAFDPMQAVPRARRPEPAPAHSAAGGPGIAGGHPDGTRLSLLQFRIRSRDARSPAPPARLSRTLPAREPTGDERPLRLGFAKGRWRVNDRVYDEGEAPIAVARGAVETWLLRNYHTSTPHAMHLHGFGFRVLARETSPDFLAPLAVDDRGRLPTDLGVRDTVLVWPGESVRIAIDFSCAFPGEQVYLVHCHNLEHQDDGMMLRFRVA